MRRGIKLTIIIFISILAGAVLYLSLVPIDLSAHRSSIEALVYERSGNRVTSESISLKVFPSPDIVLKDVTVFEEEMEVLKARNMRLKLSLLPLLYGKTVIKRMGIEGFSLSIRRDREGNINAYPIYERMRKRERKPFIKVLSIKDGALSFVDEMPGMEGAFEVTGLEGTVERPEEGIYRYGFSALLEPHTEFSIKGESRIEEDAYVHSGTLSAPDIEVSRFLPYAKLEGLALKGRMDINSSYSYGKEAEVLASLGMRDMTVLYPRAIEREVSVSGDATLRIKKDEAFSVTLDRMELEVEGFEVLGMVELTSKDGLKTLDLNVKTTEVPLEKLKLVPRGVLPEKTARALQGLKPAGGGFTVEELSIKGDLDRELFKKGEISASVALRDLGFRYGSLRDEFSGVSGSVSLKEKTLVFKRIAGSYGSGVIKDFHGEVRGLDGTPSYDLSLNAFFEAERTVEVLKEVAPGDGLRKALDEVKASGLVTVDINARGAAAGVPALRGTLGLDRVDIEHPSMPAPAKSLKGLIGFDEKKATIRGLAGEVPHGVKFDMKGTVSDYRGKPLLDITTLAEVSPETISYLTRSPLEEVAFAPFPVSARISGRMDSLSIDAYSDMGGAEFQYRKAIRKAKGYPASMDASLKVGRESISVDKLVIKFGGSSVDARGSVSRDLKAYSLRFSSAGINMTDLAGASAYFGDETRAGGRVSLELGVSKEKEKVPYYDGRVRLEEARFETPVLPKPVERVNLEGTLKGNTVKVSIITLRVGKSALSGTVDITDVAAKKTEFDIEAASFYLDDFLKKSGKVRKEKPPSKKRVTGSGRVRIKEGRAWRINFRDLASEVTLDDGAIRSDATFIMSDGPAKTSLTIYRKAEAPLLFDLDYNYSDIQIGNLIQEVGAKEDILSGIMKGDVHLSCRRGVRAPLCLNGTVGVTAERGKMWKYLVISKIFSIVNIISIDELLKGGLPYRFIKADFTITDGVLASRNVIFDSDSMRMSAAIDINMPDKVIDGTIGVHPFVTIDKIITTIPLAGWILAGKEKATISMYYSIKGPLKNPDVDPVPVKGISEAIFGKLQRLLELPLEIINGNGKVRQ